MEGAADTVGPGTREHDARVQLRFYFLLGSWVRKLTQIRDWARVEGERRIERLAIPLLVLLSARRG